MSVDSSEADTAKFPRIHVFDSAQGKAVPSDRLHPDIVLAATGSYAYIVSTKQASHRDGIEWKILRLPDRRVTSSVHTLSRHRLPSIVPRQS
ncbi:hypothetical protein NEUTE1DRAFT_102700 [Neurospora tetrasperma FGSC 2508]|uniref:Uncharacterized protein n=1 Tax=Neurospora tetrasperma (strain FGSC 2508 / ATCC MYA-4615 / P0657) TaxID=510951 RepID=F8MTD2_NEUT8|nr:uncharacterized protein NEUTE1DRAFT_102700 [Neurospora tetrasperma FGSC 2508]EGO55264.1 hypothetical protein NEUTE1DRAFT_102700 [Neurospora tetrasperma FGSC 2508]